MRHRLGTLVAAIALGGLAPAAHAAPADLDPTFDADGVAVAAAAGRVNVQSAPIVQADGRVVVAGINSATGRVFVQRFTASGAPDASFGSGGEVATALVAPQGRVAVAAAPDGGFHVASPASSGSRVVLTRFNANGSVASSVTANVPGSLSYPGAAVVRPDGTTYVGNKFDCGSGVQCFGVLKFKGAGLDATFAGGYVKTKIGSFSQPLGLAVVTGADGKDRVVVAGSVGQPGTAGADTALVRYTSTGALDTTFGAGGIQTLDLSGAGAGDHAAAVAGLAGGGVLIAGAAGTQGYVARLTSTGALDGGFGTGGIVRGGFSAGPYQANGLALDANARIVVAGQSADATGRTRWTATRLTPAGGFDNAFTPGGTKAYTPCENASGHGTFGVAITPAGKIHLSGNCNADGRAAVARLASLPVFTGTPGLTVTPGTEAAGRQRIPLASIDPTAVIGFADSLASVPLRSGPLRSGPLRSGPLRSGPLRSGPLRSGPLRSGDIGSLILLSSVPLRSGSWAELLAPFYPDGDVPPEQTLTLADAFRIAPDVVGALTYDQIDLEATPLADASLAAVLLGNRPLSALPAPPEGWCAFLAGKPLDCTNGVDPATTSLFRLEYGGDDLAAYYARPLSLKAPTDLGTGDARAPLSYVLLTDVSWKDTPAGDLPAAQIADLLACGAACTGTLADRQAADPDGFSSATVGQLIAKLPLTGLADLTLGQLLPGLIVPEEIPYELTPQRNLLDAAEQRAANLQTYAVAFEVDCTQAAGLEVVPDLPGDARLVPGSATVAAAGGAATPVADAVPGADGRPAYAAATGCAGRSGPTTLTLSFKVEPGSSLGPQAASATVRAATDSRTATTSTRVDDSLDPGDGFTEARPLGTDRLLTGHISSPRDVDTFTFQAPPPGTHVSITLSHLPADFDLNVYGPVTDLVSAPLRSGPLRSGPLRSGAVPDSSQDPTDAGVLEPDTLQDVPLRSGPLRSGSINRGRADEAVTFTVRGADAGGTFTVQVIGFGGANEAEPYVLRRVDLPGAPPPPCPARTGTSAGAPGAWPAAIPDDTRALYLVNRQRLAGRDGAEDATAAMEALAAVAEATDGVVLPVESHPSIDTGGAYAAWDAEPCDEQAANAVVERINAIVDDVRQRAGGLPGLRSIVVVGPDSVVPQARLRDETVLSNENEYADEALVRGGDNAVSGALREGYLLTDDPYGDFDATGSLYVPDVALGRLVETADEITAQAQRFTATGGIVRPQDAYVSGYDFLKDGTQEQADALARTFGTSSRIDETWTAADAQAAINRSSAGLTAVNAHYDHYRALPAAAFNGDDPNLLFARDASPQPGSVLFTMGCHSGLNMSVALADPSAGEALRLGDWAQRLGAQNALFAGSTGFSYGDTESVAYTERIMAAFADNLASRAVTVGQAMMYAKQSGAASIGVLDDYWRKAAMGATFYGLPMYRVGEQGGEGAPGMPRTAGAAAPAGDTRSSDPLSISLGDRFQRIPTDRGDFWTAAGQDPLVVQHRPIQPKYSQDVTSDNGPATGFLIEGLVMREVTGVEPVIARPTVDLEAHEPEPPANDPFFPASLAHVTAEATPEGRRDTLTVMAGQFRGDRQRLFTSISGRVLRSKTDGEPLTIRRVDGTVSGGSFSIRVDVDGEGAIGGNVLFVTDADVQGQPVTWRKADLSVLGGGVLAAGGPMPAGATRIVEAYVQVLNRHNVVSTSTRKVEGYAFAPTGGAGTGDPVVRFDPPPPPSGYYQTPPAIRLDPGAHGDATFEVAVDAGAFRPHTPGTDISLEAPTDGEHVIRFRSSDGAVGAARLAVDSTGPTVAGEADRVSNAHGWYAAPVTITWRCSDSVSGAASCSAPVTLSSEGAGQGATGSGTDRAGNAGTGSVSGIDIDLTDPTITGAIDGTPNERGWYLTAPTVRFACADALSGIDACPPEQRLGEGGGQRVEGTARDRAGRSATTRLDAVDVDLADPEVDITSGSPLLLGQPLRGTASDTATGSGIASVVVVWTGFGTVEREGTLTCDAENSCTWEAGLPGLGVWSARAIVTERSGRVVESDPKTFTITLGG